MVKIVTLFLIAMMVIALFGRFRFPNAPLSKFKKTAKCPACGRPEIGRGSCPCGAKRK
ncbi:hypothetical protein AQS8620_03113 [Aquimixticola soesokkakensis]|uniref:Uncharacterized protein n=1 Tax=Aquimixticola soesokkakensis TaxID=1519096 RepID=A0A1Y5TS37_9RHOB|nr:hypothetical protein AQS8620_03113 [Aquimixticola soesokkakensis]